MKIESLLFSEISNQDLLVWRNCAKSQPLVNPLNDPDYFSCLLRSGIDSRVLLGRDAPFSMFWPYEKTGALGSRPVAASISDCSQLIVTPEAELDPSLVLREAGLRFYEFDHLFEPHSFDPGHFAYFTDPCYLIELHKGREYYLEELTRKGSKIAAEARRKRNKLEREIGKVSWIPASSDPKHLQLLIDWKINQLDRQGFSHSFREDWLQRFMEQHLSFPSDHCQGKLSVLIAGEQVVALHYGSWGESAINSWVPAVSPDHTKYSPVLCLYMELIQEAYDNGIQTIILGRGENQTKIRLANNTIHNYVGRITTTLFGKTRIWGMKGLYRSLHSRWGNYVRESVRRLRKKSVR